MTVDPAAKFDPARAGEYDQQSRIALENAVSVASVLLLMPQGSRACSRC